MTSKIKVDNIANQSDSNIVNKCSTTITVGTGSDTTNVPGAAVVTGNVTGANVIASGNVVKSNALQASDGGVIISQSGTTITLGASGDTVSLASGASQTGFGRTGTVDWQTGSIKTSTFTAVSGQGFFADTSSSAFTMNLPAGTAGSIVSVADYTNTFQTNNLTIAPNGSQKIGGTAASHALNTEGQSITLVYVDDTEGWKNVQDSTSNITGSVPYITASGGTESTCGDCKIHKFTSPGTFSVTAASTIPANNVFKYLVVGGGGGGRSQNGSARGGGGGGGGGYRASSFGPSPLQGTNLTGSVASFPIAVGGGGAGAEVCTGGSSGAAAGSVSTFSTITSAGGGFGGGADPNGVPGGPGGSGGGAGDGGGVGNTRPGGTGNTPPVSPPQGNNGGQSGPNPNNNGGGGAGGGGAGGGGGNAQASGPSYPRSGGSAGSGVPNAITGSSVTYSEGGAGAPTASQTPTAGPANSGDGASGGGGGYPGGSPIAGAAGGSGIVVIRYKYQN